MGLLCEKTKVGCAIPIVISPEFHTGQHRDDHQINTPHFSEILTGFCSVEFGADNRMKSNVSEPSNLAEK